MDILPAIDLLEGQVVRLERGDYALQTTYSTDPAGVAGEFCKAGAKWIHVVDLDAARSGLPTNTPAVEAIRSAVNVRIELGGGARSEGAIDTMLSAGVTRVVVGSAALQDWAWFEQLLAKPNLAGRVALGLDAKGGRLAVDGWTKEVEATAVEIARRVRGWPLGAIVYTDIHRDGTLTGVNADATAELIAATDVPVIASGGVGSLDDVARCKEIGCAGVVIGKAYYEGKIDLVEALKLAGE